MGMKTMLRQATVFLLVAGRLATATYCDNIFPPVPRCPDNDPRDLLFLVDGSNSMNKDRFFREMLDYCLSLYCAFDPLKANQAGLIVFNEEIKVYVPLAKYSPDEWFAKVELVRATKDTATPACCSCCTPTAR
jgi:von Willebrand factor type A domain